MMTIVIEQVCLLIAFAAVGFLLCKTKIADAGQSKMLSVVCFYIFLPSKVFTTFAEQFTPKYLAEYWPLLLGAISKEDLRWLRGLAKGTAVK
jgi:predicted permease